MTHTTDTELKARLVGPVNSIPTPFTPSGDVDYTGLRRIIDTGIEAGSAVSLLTAGDSQYGLLAEQEVAELTRVLVEQARGRAVTVAAVYRWPTRQAVDFARYCRGLGVDLLMALPTELAVQPAGLIAYYRAVSAVMPMMLVGYPSDAVLDALSGIPSILAFKEDGTMDYAVRAMQRHGRRWSFITGGGYWRHTTQRPFGCRAYFSYLCSFAPLPARRAQAVLEANDERGVAQLAADFEIPFFELAGKFPHGFHAFWRALLEIHGVAGRWLRPPLTSFSDAELETLRAESAKLEWPA